MTEEPMSASELGRRLYELRQEMREDFAELRADLRDRSAGHVSLERYEAETEARDTRLAKIEGTMTWLARTVAAALISVVVETLILIAKVR